MRPVCVQCFCEMRPLKNDFCVEEMAGTARPYRVWFADLWHCPACGARIVIGFADKPLASHYEKKYAEEAQWAELRYWPRPEMVPYEVSK